MLGGTRFDHFSRIFQKVFRIQVHSFWRLLIGQRFTLESSNLSSNLDD